MSLRIRASVRSSGVKRNVVNKYNFVGCFGFGSVRINLCMSVCLYVLCMPLHACAHTCYVELFLFCMFVRMISKQICIFVLHHVCEFALMCVGIYGHRLQKIPKIGPTNRYIK